MYWYTYVYIYRHTIPFSFWDELHVSQPDTAEMLQFTPGACTESHILTQSLWQALRRVCRHQFLHTPAHQAHSPCLHEPFTHHCMPAQLLVPHIQTIYLSHPIFWMTEIWILLCSHYHNTGLMLCPVTQSQSPAPSKVCTSELHPRGPPRVPHKPPAATHLMVAEAGPEEGMVPI